MYKIAKIHFLSLYKFYQYLNSILFLISTVYRIKNLIHITKNVTYMSLEKLYSVYNTEYIKSNLQLKDNSQ